MMNLWYENAAEEWTQALPLGNGHLGAMAYGGAVGRFDLSENTCWSGGPPDGCLSASAGESMRRARQLLTDHKITEAEELLQDCIGIKGNYGTQVPMGRLWVGVNQAADSVRRELDLVNGVCTDQMRVGNLDVTRRSFISSVHKVMAVQLTAEPARLPQLRIWVEGWSQPSHTRLHGHELTVRGRALENIHSDGLQGVEYVIQARVITDGRTSWSRQGLLIDGATSLVLHLTAATDFFGADPLACCQAVLNQAAAVGWADLLEAHGSEHSDWMNRCRLTLPANAASRLPTDQRILAFRQDNTDHELVALFFQYGRYLLLNSSRPDSLLPAALQGIWNDDRACRMEWTDDMHLDINTQMNYYPAEVTGLSECSRPLFSWIKNILVPNGEQMARQLYGCPGWVAHTVSNARGWAAPGWDVVWGFCISGGAWIATHIWEHYLYTGDLAFLREHFDVLYQAARFLQAVLVQDPATGELLTNPSYSPENAYRFQGRTHWITVGATLDISVSRYLFTAVSQGAALLDCEDEWTRSLPETISRLPAFKKGRHGQLQEWAADYEEAIPDHRHTSHLLATYPLNLINPDRSPELKAAVETSLRRRLGENAVDIILYNWAGALLVLYQARLLAGEAAGGFVKPMIAFLSRANMMITHEGPTTSITGGIYELDGNTGFTAAIAEMLLQSYSGEIHVLPAIPKAWHTGEYSGLVAQGGHRVDVRWQPGLCQVGFLANATGRVIIRFGGERRILEVVLGEHYELDFAGKSQ